jgi:hypothetical protein
LLLYKIIIINFFNAIPGVKVGIGSGLSSFGGVEGRVVADCDDVGDKLLLLLLLPWRRLLLNAVTVVSKRPKKIWLFQNEVLVHTVACLVPMGRFI